MKRFYAIAILLLASATLLRAQTQLVNSNFELWDNIAATNAEPQEWNSNKTGSGFASLGPQTCFAEATIVHGGTYSVKLRTVSSGFGSNVNGVVTCGRVNAPSTTPSAGYNDTQQANAPYNMPFTGRPDSVAFWAYYVPGAGDSARVSIMLHSAYDQRDPTSNDPNGATNVIGSAMKNFRSTASTWVRISVPFVYTSGSTPAYCLATLTASKVPGGGSTSTLLYVDDLVMIYNPVASCGPVNPLTYYVSATQGTSASLPYTLSPGFAAGNTVTGQLSNAAGSFASPATIGTLTNTNTSGTLSATIPAGTPTGSGYRMRVTCSSPAFTGTDNGANIQIYLVSNAVTPSAAQTLEAGVNGTLLTANENITATSREWKYATVSGGPYSSFVPAETGTTYSPNFASNGTYYVVCESSWPGGIVERSNEVTINVVDNAVNPSGSQSLLVGANGNLLTVTETPAGTSRLWHWSSTPGGPYAPFNPFQMGFTYLPNFSSPGTYYIVCVSTISGISVTSNEVQINVSNATITTGTVTGSPYEFSPSAPDANVTVPYTTNGTFNAGNVFTAQLSDAGGSFGSPVNIGTVSSTTSGSINATISHLTAAGTGYRIRVVSSNPSVLGSDNGTDLVVDQFSNSVAPGATQTIPHSTNGTAIAVTASQTASHDWQFATSSGGPYSSFVPAQTSGTYTPNFSTPGTYYVVCASTNQHGDAVLSNEVEIVVTNGNTLSTDAVTSPFYLSSNALVQANVDFTTDIVFDASNVFTAELSDQNGSFAAATAIGTLSGAFPGTIIATIPNNSPDGTGYRIRVTSSNPATTGTDNGSDLQVIQLANSIAPVATQTINMGLNGTPLTVTCTHPGGTQEWQWRTGLGAFASFTPNEISTSYTPNFASAAVYIVRALSFNTWGDTAISNEVLIEVTDPNAVDEASWSGGATVRMEEDQLVADLTALAPAAGKWEVRSALGQVLAAGDCTLGQMQEWPIVIAAGNYFFTLRSSDRTYVVRFVKP